MARDVVLIQIGNDGISIDGQRFIDAESARRYCTQLCNNGSTPNGFNVYRAGRIGERMETEARELEGMTNAMLAPFDFSKQFK